MTSHNDDSRALAADFVLGVLDAADRAKAEALMASDASFAAEIERWRERLADLDASATPLPPDQAVWSRIESAIAAPPPASRPARPALWHSLRAWRAIGLIASAASLLFAVAFGVALREAQRTPALIAVLVDGNRTGAVVQVFNDGRAVLLPLTDIAVPADRALQVWTLPSRERGPVSVGLMDQARTLPLTLKDLPAPRSDQLFEITLEPKGGSPTGRPTGPILFKGLASRAL
ncbi:MAG: anti-sigma factor [Pseudolabrys sp.]|nr:anti-sigma factor [Pseudolabrys sp.]